MRVVVDPNVCEANGLCAGIAPDVFRLGDDDVLTLLLPDPPEERRAAVLQAARSCPKQAITVVDGEQPLTRRGG